MRVIKRLLILFPLLLLIAHSALGAITEVGTSTSCDTGNAPLDATTLNCEHDAGTGSNRITIVGVSARGGPAASSSITYGGNAMTKLVEQLNSTVSLWCELWYLVNPPTGVNTATVDRAVSGWVMGLMTLANVDQANPFSASISDQDAGSGSTSATLNPNIVSAAGEVVIDVVAKRGNGGSLTADVSQTEQWDDVTAIGTELNNVRGGGSTKPGAASVDMTWTLGENSFWTICAGSLIEATLSPQSGLRIRTVIVGQ